VKLKVRKVKVYELFLLLTNRELYEVLLNFSFISLMRSIGISYGDLHEMGVLISTEILLNFSLETLRRSPGDPGQRNTGEFDLGIFYFINLYFR
jgi:hypothetical protein